MSIQNSSAKRVGIFLPPGEGRTYPMGRISAVFKADGDETQRAYSISEWWLEPHSRDLELTPTRTTTFSM